MQDFIKKMIVLACLLRMISISTAIVSPSDMQLVQIAQNTLSSVRELNHIVNETHRFNENFEKAYSAVDTRLWKADRAVMVMEDMKSLQADQVHDINDFNYILSRIKDTTKEVRRNLIKRYNEDRKTEVNNAQVDDDIRRSVEHHKKLVGAQKNTMSAKQAQIETAKNTKDMLTQISLLKIENQKMRQQLNSIQSHIANESRNKDARKLLNHKKYLKHEKGALGLEVRK